MNICCYNLYIKVVINYRCAYLIKSHHIYINARIQIQLKKMQNACIEQILSYLQNMMKCINISQMPDNEITSLTEHLKCFILIPDIKQIVSQQQAASVINFFIIERGIKADLKKSAKILFQLLFNWKISLQVKFFLKNSLVKMLSSVDNLNYILGQNNCFQQATIALANTMQLANNHYPQQQMTFNSNLIDTPFFQTPISLTIQTPDNADEVYHTILFMIESVVVDIPPNQLCKERRIPIIKALRSIINIVITEQNLRPKIKIIKYAIQILQGLCDRFFDFDNKNHQGITQLAIEIGSWNQLTDKFQMIYQYKTTLSCLHGINQTNLYCYNYLGWNEELDSLLYNLKIQSARAHSFLLIILHQTPSLLTTQLANIVQELLYTLKYYADNYKSLEKTAGQLAFRFISLLGIFLQGNQVSLECMLTVLNQILIPIISKQIEAKKQTYDTNPKQLFMQLQSCLQGRQFDSMLTEISKIFELMVLKNQAIFIFLAQYFKYSIESSQGMYQSTPPSQIENIRPMDITTALFVFSVVSYQAIMYKQVGQVLQKLMVPQLYNQLDDYQKIYFFTLMTIHWPQVYSNKQDEGIYLFEVVLDPHSSQNLKIFALDFIVNVCQYYFCEPFFETFIRNFTKLQKGQSKWTILGKILKKHMERISDDYLCNLVQVMRLHAQKQMHILLQNITIGLKADSSDLVHYIQMCKIIAQQCERCRDKPIQNELFLLIQNIEQMNKIYVEDQILRLADNLLDQYTTLPNHFISFLNKTAIVYENNQYQGNPFYAVLNKYTMLCTHNPQMQYKLYQILMVGLSYFTYFPDDVDKQFNVDQQLNNQLIMMANYLLVYGHQMQSQTLHKLNQIVSVIQQTLSQRENKVYLFLLNARNRVVQIICNFYLKQPLCLQKLLHQSSNIMYNQYDSFIIIYVLTMISHIFKRREQKKIVLQILVNLFKTAQQNQINKKEQFTNFIEDKQTKPFNNILCYVQPVVKLQYTIAQQITKFFDQCFKRDKSFNGTIFTLEREDYELMIPLAKSSTYDPFEQIDIQLIQKSIKKRQFVNDYKQPQSRKRTADYFTDKMQEQPHMLASKRRKQPDQAFEKNLLQRIQERHIKKQYKIHQ